MKIQIISDIHLEFKPFTLKVHKDADVLVIAGDATTTRLIPRFKSFLRPIAIPIVYVLGNHEFYGSSLSMARHELAQLHQDFKQFHLLDDSFLDLDGVRFAGGTLWPNFELPIKWSKGAKPKIDVERAQQTALIGISDFNVIADLTPKRCVDMNNQTRKAIASAKENFAGPVVVVTHFLPSEKSIDPHYKDNILNPYFASNCEYLMGGNVKLWIHGHTHTSADYTVKGTRVVCNPRGYPEAPNRSFQDLLCVEV